MRLRSVPDDLDDLAVLCGNTAAYRMARSTRTSRDLATELSDVLGPHAPIVDLYLDELSYAPVEHLAILARRGTRIVFAPTIDSALTSAAAARRRQRSLSWDEARQIRIDYGPASGAAAAYDQETDWLIFPTSYAHKERKRAVLHELGHALTMGRAQVRAALLRGLPRGMERHVFSHHYEVGGDPEQTLRQRVLEALAEGYILLVDGRLDQLPQALASELIFMLQTVDDGEQVRFEFQQTPNGERTASRASEREIVGVDDPEHGHLFAPVRLDRSAEPWSLSEDQLAARRRRSRTA
jgi:hypothetical protein